MQNNAGALRCGVYVRRAFRRLRIQANVDDGHSLPPVKIILIVLGDNRPDDEGGLGVRADIEIDGNHIA